MKISFRYDKDRLVDTQIILSAQDIRDGVYRDIDIELLLVIGSYVDDESLAYPSMETIANIMGTSRQRVSREVKVLEEKGFITVMRHREGKKLRNTYEINTNIVKKPKKHSSKDVIAYFCEQYEKTYDEKYLPNWGRDTKMVKNTLMTNFDQQKIEQVISFIMKEYQTRWATKQYPRPTMGAMCSWLFNSAQGFMPKDKEIVEVDINKYNSVDF